MSRIGFVGGSYEGQSLSADAQSCLNFYVEHNESGSAKSEFSLMPTAGLAPFCGLPDSPTRAEWQVQIPNSIQRAFAIAGSTLFEVFADGTNKDLGAVANDGKPASMRSSSIELMIASGGQGYCLNLATNVLTGPIATIAGVVQVGYSDGFFGALIGNSAQIFISAPLDGTTWDPAQTAIVSVFPDNIVSIVFDHRAICLLGQKQSVCYYDSGNTFPYDVVPGSFVEQGSAATFGTAQIDNTVFWIGQSEHGARIAWRAQQYTPTRISTHAIEFAWQSYPRVDDTVAYSYQDQGHSFVQWFFPSANNGNGATWVYDVATGLWHERAFGSGANKTAHRSWCHMYAFGKHLVGDWKTGNIYEMHIPKADGAGGWLFADDFGNPIRRVRRSPYVGQAGVFNYFKSLEIMAEPGLGPEIPLLSGGTAAYDSTGIQLVGGVSVPQYSCRLATSSGVGHNYQVSATYGNIGLVPITISLYLFDGAISSQTLNPGDVEVVTLNIVGTGAQLRYGISATAIGATAAAIGFNPQGSDLTAGTPLTIPPTFTGGTWSAFGSGAAIAVDQGEANPFSSPRDPQMMLRWSKDGAKTWSQERILNMGQIGKSATRMIARRLPRVWGSIGMVFEIAFSDPCPIRIIDADLDADPDMGSQKRLAQRLREQS